MWSMRCISQIVRMGEFKWWIMNQQGKGIPDADNHFLHNSGKTWSLTLELGSRSLYTIYPKTLCNLTQMWTMFQQFILYWQTNHYRSPTEQGFYYLELNSIALILLVIWHVLQSKCSRADAKVSYTCNTNFWER